MDNKKLLVVIPSYNEEESILKTVQNLESKCNFDYIVIDDGSSDNTLELLQKNNINYISHKKNMGLSQAVRTGMKYALDNQYDYVIQIDGDNQHNPIDIENFLQKAYNDNILVIGNRYKSSKPTNSLKTLAQRYISFWFKLKTKVKLFDPTNGMRLYGKTFMQHYIENHNLMVEPSTIAFLVKKYNLEIIQVHTDIKEREYGQSMYNNHWKQLKYIIRETVRMLPLNNGWATKKMKEK